MGAIGAVVGMFVGGVVGREVKATGASVGTTGAPVGSIGADVGEIGAGVESATHSFRLHL